MTLTLPVRWSLSCLSPLTQHRIQSCFTQEEIWIFKGRSKIKKLYTVMAIWITVIWKPSRKIYRTLDEHGNKQSLMGEEATVKKFLRNNLLQHFVVCMHSSIKCNITKKESKGISGLFLTEKSICCHLYNKVLITTNKQILQLWFL